ncbi:hypothetical protein WAI453_013608 [Rhynchosporium graminicola]|uniref:Uncharacterized protein n=2 Tax=Rhynchosporium TaxID=38037 RepID=A0A1E1MRG5_RHYSE|nr:uncharacterized protein RSE6_12874 [Rhynchosporium secalis]
MNDRTTALDPLAIKLSSEGVNTNQPFSSIPESLSITVVPDASYSLENPVEFPDFLQRLCLQLSDDPKEFTCSSKPPVGFRRLA